MLKHRAVIQKLISLLGRVILMERSVSHNPSSLFTYKYRVPEDMSVMCLWNLTLNFSVKIRIKGSALVTF